MREAGDRSKGKVTKMEGLFTLVLPHRHDRKERMMDSPALPCLPNRLVQR